MCHTAPVRAATPYLVVLDWLGPLIGMNMSKQHDVNIVLCHEPLIALPHAVVLLVVTAVAVVPGGVDQHNQPGGS